MDCQRVLERFPENATAGRWALLPTILRMGSRTHWQSISLTPLPLCSIPMPKTVKGTGIMHFAKALIGALLIAVSTNAQNFRLPLNVIPSHYDIEVQVKLDPAEDFTFSGIVSINFTCVEATDTVVIHNYNLTVDEANVVLQARDESGTSVGIDRHEYEWDYAKFQTIFLTESLVAGHDYRLTIPYSGTHLEPTSSRALYPCFDEPGLKATFSITVGHTNKYQAFTNMPLTSSAVDPDPPNIIWDYHETTVVMSPYLVAIIVGDFTRVPTSDPRQFILVRDEVTNLTGDAAVFAPAILNEMETRLSTPFPLPKLDHAGLVGFSGGMENYGLIFYNEDEVARSDGSASLTLMAHETSHMWTGNLVTCQWWDVAWLNEGMTHFFTYFIAEKIDRKFPYFDKLGTEMMDKAMGYDFKPSALPMVIPIIQPNDISNAFGGDLIYKRGGNIGRMMYYLLGEEVLIEGMKNYFADNQFKSVTEEHLFTALNNAAEAAGLELEYSVSELISPFTNQAGYPLVNVTNTGVKEDGKSVYKVSQVNYDTVTWNKILDALKVSRKTFPNTNVAAIISDGLQLCRLNLVDPDVCKRFPEKLRNERSLIVWLTAAKNLHTAIANAADTTAELTRIKKIVKKAEFNVMRSREVMTPEHESLLDLLRNFSKHLEGPNATRSYISSHEAFWDKIFEDKEQDLKMQFSHHKIGTVLETAAYREESETISQEFRLPTKIIPSHYDVDIVAKLDPDENFTFFGTVDIFFTCVEATDSIILHNWLLLVDEANVLLQDQSGNLLNIDHHEYDWDYAEFQKIFLVDPLELGNNYKLTIPYAGNMSSVPSGLWYGSYVGDQGSVEYFAGTQHGTVSTRAVFPCFDEPAFKATFRISVGHHSKYSAFSNMPLVETIPHPDLSDYVTDYFEISPVMSTYIVAIVIGDYTRVPTDDPKQFVLVRDEITGLTGDAVNYVPDILREMEARFLIPYPLPKLDHAGLIGFGGGMENYGLILYVEDGIASEEGKANLELLTHEIAHMWAGNLVTCEWWDVSWLNEGMTEFFTFLIAGFVDTTYPYMDLLATRLMEVGMDYDSDSSALPLVVPINEPADIDQNAFNGPLIYYRGGAIGGVIYQLLGDQAFLAGIQTYFAQHMFQTVREEDLFLALNTAAEEAGLGLEYSVADLISPFTNQAGVPLVTVTNTGVKENGKSVYTVSQRRLLNVMNNEHNDDTLWPIVLTWATSSAPDFEDKTPKAYLTEASMTVTIAGDDDWVLFNNKRSGYYRVNYDTVTWTKILDALENAGNPFPDTNIAAVISDALELCLLGLVDPDVCDRIPNTLGNQTSLFVWISAVRNLHKSIARAADEVAELNRIKEIVNRAEFDTSMRTRKESMPDDQHKKLLNLLKDFKHHLEGSNAANTFISLDEELRNKRLQQQQKDMIRRISHDEHS
ncbi:unnamed protein product [Notodromas monacha]|uniref:Aminopeptidase n=1 Tax=Notodromas monacha TaxID=399045 RepID=A0A7R9BZC0_9CRUS|nr:unnamed protein product [Notodromas monacha]CAG0923104.1 unnamed protein product [Notodromas monacha]